MRAEWYRGYDEAFGARKMSSDAPQTTNFRFAVLRVEREVNAQLGGSAGIAELVELMLSMGWTPPATVKEATHDD